MDESEVEALFRELVEPDKGTVTVSASEHGTDFVIEPANSKAARMSFNLAPDGGEIAGTLGLHTPVEIPQHGSRYSASIGVDELRLLVQAVVTRGFVETVWTQFGYVVRSRAVIQIDGTVHKISSQTIWRIPFLTGKQTITYEPY